MTANSLAPQLPNRRHAKPSNTAEDLLRTESPAALHRRFPPRPVMPQWPMTVADVEYIVAGIGARYPSRHAETLARRLRGIRLVLSWLSTQPGSTWQQRWLASGAEQLGRDWTQVPLDYVASTGAAVGASTERRLRQSVQLLIVFDVIRPGLRWLTTRRSTRLAAAMTKFRDPEGMGHVAEICRSEFGGKPHTVTGIHMRLAVILAAKGGRVGDITVGDYVQSVEAQGGRPLGYFTGGTMLLTYSVLRAMGVFGPDTPLTFRVFRQRERLTIEQLVDRRGIVHRPIRDLIVAYLRERAAALDYVSLVNLEAGLAKQFWRDLELHHPGITSLDLPADVAAAWKQRLQYKTTTVQIDTGPAQITTPRKSFTERLIMVRGFYLDLAQWAAEDPGRWAQWVAPCPIRANELQVVKHQRHRKANIDQRTRERLPVLPVLAHSVNKHRLAAAELLAAARTTAPGTTFTAAGQTLRRAHTPMAQDDRVYGEDPASGERRNLTLEETHAFWAWATVEVLRHTGIRIEELLELTHHSLIQYRLPSTGEIVPLLQIAPSKSDTERLLLVSPELADVLAAIVARLRNPATGALPMTASRDDLERVWREPQPVLFQYRHASEYRATSRKQIANYLNRALLATGLHDRAGQPLRFTAHDFRRIFVTDAILNGLPPHIAQIICGHRDINTTMGYKAAYPDEAIEAHRAYLARRRALRPSDEYRTPTDTEWQEFLGHFERRKVSLGTCARAFGTPCIHEHACVRCPMLWPDPAQQPRLAEIRDNLLDRIAEAEREGWLGEAEGLQISLAGANQKLAQIEQANNRQTTGSSNSVPLTITTRPPTAG